MNRSEKTQIIKELTSSFFQSNGIIACDYKALTVLKLEDLRNTARVANINVQVVKNSLASIALANANVNGLELKDMNIFVWGEDAIATSKIVAKFAEKNESFVVRTAYLDGEVANAAKVSAYAKLLGREELLGMLASVWMAPIRNFTIGLDQLRIKKEQ